MIIIPEKNFMEMIFQLDKLKFGTKKNLKDMPI